MNDLSNINWESILNALEKKRCVLFIGKGAYQASGGGSIEVAMQEALKVNDPDHPYIKLHNSDGFYLFKDSFSRQDFIDDLKKFYQQSFPETESDLKLLAAIPFNMIFSMSPDNFISGIYNVCNLDFSFDYFNKNVPETCEIPTPEKPLIYNLFGNIDDGDSLVLTHNDLFNYLQLAFEENKIHTDIKYQLEKKISNFIFLGLPFEKWYFQLLLRVLSLHSDKFAALERLALNNFEDDNFIHLYTEEFKIDFIQSDVSNFIKELHRHCDEKGLLKKVKTTKEIEIISFEEVKSLITDAKEMEAISKLEGYFASTPSKFSEIHQN